MRAYAFGLRNTASHGSALVALCCAGMGCGSEANETPAEQSTPSGGCAPLDTYTLEREVTLPEIPAEGSGITYNFESDTFLIVANLQGMLWEYDRSFTRLLRTLSLQNIDNDTEGLAYVGQGYLAVVAEDNRVYVGVLDPSSTVFDGASGVIFAPSDPPPVSNAGFEGVAYRQPSGSTPGQLLVCQEHQPMRVLAFDDNGIRTPGSTFSAADGTLSVAEPWQAETVLNGQVTDLAGMVHDGSNDTLLIVSQESSSVVRVNPETGRVLERLALVGTSTSEGISLGDGCRLVVLSEPNRVQIYAPGQL